MSPSQQHWLPASLTHHTTDIPGGMESGAPGALSCWQGLPACLPVPFPLPHVACPVSPQAKGISGQCCLWLPSVAFLP